VELALPVVFEELGTVEKVREPVLLTEEKPIPACGPSKIRSFEESRNGAIPAPGPHMIDIGCELALGRRKERDSCTLDSECPLRTYLAVVRQEAGGQALLRTPVRCHSCKRPRRK